jgi:spore germination cell wall hydrolase CwlJ-like protein
LEITADVSQWAAVLNTPSTTEGNVVLKKSKAAFAAVVLALSLFNTSPANAANAWKMDPLSSQVTMIQKAQELQETDRRELLCLSLAIYHESKGQSEKGMRAVGHVVLNRKKSGKFPATICGVVWQPSQFSWSVRPVMGIVPREKANWVQSQEIAYRILNGDEDLTKGALYFYNVKTDRPAWRTRGVMTFVDGPHVFRKF